MRSVELFVGAGGLAMGVSRAGFSHDVVIEWDQYACDTLRENGKRRVIPIRDWPEVTQIDVREFDYSSISKGVALVAGGPPCQPFSLGGRHRGKEDHRDMFPEAVRAVRELRPLAFVFENVRGLIRPAFKDYLEYVLLQLSRPHVVREKGESWTRHRSRIKKSESRQRPGDSYVIHHGILNASDYGVPQHRERLFVAGFRRDLDVTWSFPTPTHSRDVMLWTQWVSGEYWERHNVPRRKRPKMPGRVSGRVKRLTDGLFGKPWVTVRDAIFDLPEPTVDGEDGFLNHKLNSGARSYPGHTGSPLDLPAKTLKAGVHGVPGGENMLRYPSGKVRYFTVRESARLQCFPDAYGFPGIWSESMRQLGNAVPVALATKVASSVRQKIEKHVGQKARAVVSSPTKARGRRNGRGKPIQSPG